MTMEPTDLEITFVLTATFMLALTAVLWWLPQLPGAQG